MSELTLRAFLLPPLSSSQLPSQLVKEPAGSKGRRSNGDGQGKPRKRRSEAKVCGAALFPIWWSHSRSALVLNKSFFFEELRERLCISVFVLQQSLMLDADGGSLSPGSKPHICEHCSAAFRSSYHLRRHVLIHTGIASNLLMLPSASLQLDQTSVCFARAYKKSQLKFCPAIAVFFLEMSKIIEAVTEVLKILGNF